MIDIGVSVEGAPRIPLRKLEDGHVVPDVSLAEIHSRQRDHVTERIECGVEADELGYDYVFQPEHHFKLLGGNSPDPIQTQTAVAARTEDVRLVQLANILPWHDPIRLAERASALDVISDERVEVGIGTGFPGTECDVFGQYWGASRNRRKNFVSFTEAYEILLSAWTDDAVSYEGQFHTVPPKHAEFRHEQERRYFEERDGGHDPGDFFDSEAPASLDSIGVFPRPRQQPHPQLWRPLASREAIEWAAGRGVNGCCFCVDFQTTRNVVDAYHSAAEAGGWQDHRPEYSGEPFRRGWDGSRKRGVAAQVVTFNTDVATDGALERWKRGQEFNLTAKRANEPDEAAEEIPLDADRFVAENDAPIVGGSRHIADRLATFVEVCGYEDVILVPQFDSVGLAHEETMAQLHAFAEEVLPALEKRL